MGRALNGARCDDEERAVREPLPVDGDVHGPRALSPLGAAAAAWSGFNNRVRRGREDADSLIRA